MDLFIYISTILIVLTKLYESFIQLRFITDVTFEENPLNQALMKKTGIRAAIWILFIFNLAITIIAMIWTIRTESMLWSLIYLVAAVIASVAQVFSARKIKKYCLLQAEKLRSSPSVE